MQDHQSLKVLLVEDDLDSAQLLQDLLLDAIRFQVDVTHLQYLEAAKHCLKNQPFDAILLDLCLPDSQGLDTLTNILNLECGCRTPVVVLTGLNDEEIAIKTIHAGAQDYLLKGEITGQGLVRTLRYAIERAAIQEQLRQLSASLEAQVAESLASTAELEAANRYKDEINQQLSWEIEERQKSEAALKESEERFRLMADSAPVLIWLSGTDGLCYFFNQTWLDFTGRTPEQEFGNGWLQGVHPDDQESCINDYTNAFNARLHFQIEYRLRHVSGDYHWILDQGLPRFTPAGEFAGYIGSCIDINDRKQAEESLQQAHDELENRVMERTTELLAVNQALLSEITERKRAEKALHDIVAGTASVIGTEFFPALVKHLAQALGVRSAMATEVVEEQPGQLRVLAWWDGNQFRASCTYTAEGTPCGSVQQQAKVCYYPARLQELFPEDKILVEMNAVSYLGVPLWDSSIDSNTIPELSTKPKMIGLLCVLDDQPFKDYQRAESLMSVFAARAAAELQRERAQISLRHAHEALEMRVAERTAELSQTLQSLEAEIVERKQAEQDLVAAREAALEAARVKTYFVANMSHEIRTPMNGVLGMTELLLKTELNLQQQDLVNTLKTSGENLLTIINDILDFSKLEVGEMRLDFQEFNLSALLEDILDLFAPQAHAKGLELIGMIEPEVLRHLRGDAFRLRQVLSNLISNAIKFTDAGEVFILVSHPQPVSEKQANQEMLYFAIQDTGIGISPKGQEKLFQSFYQVDNSTTRQHGGTGLGLAISKQLVELMGGEIGVESQIGMGSTFWFTATFTQSMMQTSAMSLPSPPEIFQCKRLLVIDDSAANRRFIRQQGSAWGIQVDEAADSQEAIKALYDATLRGQPYHLALLDSQLPQMNPELLEKMFSKNQTLLQTQLILMTTLSEQRLPSDLLNFAGYLTKPIKESRLYDCLFSILQPPKQPSENHSAISPPTSEKISRNLKHSPTQISDQIPAPQNSEPPLKFAKILVVEDTPVNQKVILNQLRLLNYQADCVNNGQEALNRLAEHPYDIVLMDCQMPILDGYDATKILRQREGKQCNPIVIGLTAYAMKGDREKCLAAGMDDYLSKPVSMEDLSTALEKWTQKLEAMETPQNWLNSPSPLAGSQPGLTELYPQSLINRTYFHEITKGDMAFQVELLDSFISNTEGDLAEIRMALAVENTGIIIQKAHRIKGSSANMAIKVMPDVANQLEQLMKRSSFTGVTELVTELELILEQVKIFAAQLAEASQKSSPQSPEKKALELIDCHQLKHLYGSDGTQFQQELLQAFIADAETDLTAAISALIANDFISLAEKADALTEISQAAAMKTIPELAAQLKASAQAQQLEAAALLLAAVEQFIEEVKIYQV